MQKRSQECGGGGGGGGGGGANDSDYVVMRQERLWI